MPMDFASLPQQDQARILTMGLQQFRSGAPATKENMNRMREVLMSDPAYAQQLMTDAGIGGYGQGEDSSGWVNPAQMAYSPDTFLAEDGTDDANGAGAEAGPPMQLQGAQQSQSAPIQSRPPVRPENLNGEQAIAEEGASGGASNASTDWGTILAQVLGVGGAGAGLAYGLNRLNRKQMPPGAGSDNPVSISPLPASQGMTMPEGTDGSTSSSSRAVSTIPEGGKAIPATANNANIEEGEWRDVPRSIVDQSVDETMEDTPKNRRGGGARTNARIEQERRQQLEAPIDEDGGVKRTTSRTAGQEAKDAAKKPKRKPRINKP